MKWFIGVDGDSHTWEATRFYTSINYNYMDILYWDWNNYCWTGKKYRFNSNGNMTGTEGTTYNQQWPETGGSEWKTTNDVSDNALYNAKELMIRVWNP
jgi:hypothetical protein